MSAGESLALLLGVLALLALLFWPGKGLWWRLAGLLGMRDRVAVEDALKHLYDCEYNGRTATIESLAGALAIPANGASRLAAELEKLHLARTVAKGLELTAEGRGDALRVIRIHRLWEQYLAERTGFDEREWHGDADRREHTLTPEEVERLASRLGHPRYDPHGDPIPTADGDIAPAHGERLAATHEGQTVAIVHVEDEPEAIYAQLVAQRLTPGLRLRITEVSPERIGFEARGESHVLAPVVAANLTVVTLGDEREDDHPHERLSQLQPGEEARVLGISRDCRAPQMRRLLDLGLVPGTPVTAEFRSPNGDPTAYRIRGSLIALRRDEGEMIRIQRAG